jgi:DnaK suppressor protein
MTGEVIVSFSHYTALRRLLAQEAECLQQQIEQQETSAQPIPWQVGDEGDRAMSQIVQSNQQVLVRYLQRKLSQVQTARARLDAGTYGVCDDCSRPIPPERLQAIPYATLCVHCQSKRDRKKIPLPR